MVIYGYYTIGLVLMLLIGLFTFKRVGLFSELLMNRDNICLEGVKDVQFSDGTNSTVRRYVGLILISIVIAAGIIMTILSMPSEREMNHILDNSSHARIGFINRGDELEFTLEDKERVEVKNLLSDTKLSWSYVSDRKENSEEPRGKYLGIFPRYRYPTLGEKVDWDESYCYECIRLEYDKDGAHTVTIIFYSQEEVYVKFENRYYKLNGVDQKIYEYVVELKDVYANKD